MRADPVLPLGSADWHRWLPYLGNRPQFHPHEVAPLPLPLADQRLHARGVGEDALPQSPLLHQHALRLRGHCPRASCLLAEGVPSQLLHLQHTQAGDVRSGRSA